MRVTIDVSAAELLDRICILEIKLARLPEPARSHVERQLALAIDVSERMVTRSLALTALVEQLRAVNLVLWNVEEELRFCEQSQQFAQRFVELARAVYQSNDRRAALKSRIDELLGSELREHKSYSLPETERDPSCVSKV